MSVQLKLAMKRRDFTLGLAATILFPFRVSRADPIPASAAWSVIPTIAIISTENDARLSLVYEALIFGTAASPNSAPPFDWESRHRLPEHSRLTS